MNISTIENIHKRHKWLQDVLDGKVKLSKSHQSKMLNMKAFCNLEIPRLFKKISYNSYKNYCLQNTTPDCTHTSKNYWEHIRSLREQIHQSYSIEQVDKSALDKPSHKMMINEAFNQAQLASIAYLDLFRFITSILESDITLNEATKLYITNYLFESSLKFECVTSLTATTPRTWSVIQGGKGDG